MDLSFGPITILVVSKIPDGVSNSFVSPVFSFIIIPPFHIEFYRGEFIVSIIEKVVVTESSFLVVNFKVGEASTFIAISKMSFK